MSRKRTDVEVGVGNVFADLGYADAKERTLKVKLALGVNRVLKERKLVQAQAAELLGIVQPHVSDLVRYRLNRFSVERLSSGRVGPRCCIDFIADVIGKRPDFRLGGPFSTPKLTR